MGNTTPQLIVVKMINYCCEKHYTTRNCCENLLHEKLSLWETLHQKLIVVKMINYCCEKHYTTTHWCENIVYDKFSLWEKKQLILLKMYNMIHCRETLHNNSLSRKYTLRQIIVVKTLHENVLQWKSKYTVVNYCYSIPYNDNRLQIVKLLIQRETFSSALKIRVGELGSCPGLDKSFKNIPLNILFILTYSLYFIQLSKKVIMAEEKLMHDTVLSKCTTW